MHTGSKYFKSRLFLRVLGQGRFVSVYYSVVQGFARVASYRVEYILVFSGQHFTVRHGDKQSLSAAYNFDVVYGKAIVYNDRRYAFELLVASSDQAYSYVGYFHNVLLTHYYKLFFCVFQYLLKKIFEIFRIFPILFHIFPYYEYSVFW